MKGNVIVLNGASSSGKTTLARQLQSKLSEVYLLCSLDAFWDMTPYGVSAGSKNFPNMKLALAKSVKALAETGHNVIVDIVFCGQKTYLELTNELELFNLKVIKVECPLVELEKRELARGDRKLGLAKSQYESVHNEVLYDMIINTHINSTEQCAQKIIDSMS
ncbi:chloramphenicol phosphotransferase CPT family protein [Thalassomonas actiniarum]|uniref:AAA family ATPase n=1 Tax=Thalassomonas actiniarum TaxID=485447 RepID=A0AAE9YYB6_9GAMM|nr:AAA family ATPase [Thalassomonas actiniarum]WDE02599.1 AAA family ATPase [Thalassomonas actiniarum]